MVLNFRVGASRIAQSFAELERRMKCCLLLVFLVGAAAAAETTPTDIVTEIRDGLDKQPEEVKSKVDVFLKYLEMSDQEIVAALPLKKQGEKGGNNHQVKFGSNPLV